LGEGKKKGKGKELGYDTEGIHVCSVRAWRFLVRTYPEKYKIRNIRPSDI
jgi:hypothetical protein